MSDLVGLTDIKISLCITTMDRYDKFLNTLLKKYFEYLQIGIINEIVICDENGNDYKKIYEEYGDYIMNNTNFKVYKNDIVLGVFKNKLKVCSLARYKYVALIDSDNFADAAYFITAKRYIKNNETQFTNYVMLAPCFAKPRFNFNYYENWIITRKNIKEYCHKYYYDCIHTFETMLNTGNYIMDKRILASIQYDEEVLSKISACDVLFFNLLAFQQLDGFQMHIVKGLEYEHVVHDGSTYFRDINHCAKYRNEVIIKSYLNLEP
jgi:hypothetical protein